MEKLNRLLELLNEEFVSHPATQNLWSFYKSQPKTKQFAIRVVMFIAGVGLLWLLFISPLANFASRAQEGFIATSNDLLWMQSHRDLAQRAAEIEGKSIEAIVRESALSPYITQITPDGEIRITLTLSAAPFKSLAEALTGLSQNNGIKISRAIINRLPNRSGYVSATLVMERN